MARRATPLFELLSEQTDRSPGEAPESPSSTSAPMTPVTTGDAGRASPPAVTTRPQPAPAPDQTEPSDSQSQAEAQSAARAELRVPLSWAYIGGASALLLVLLVWTTGYHLGAHDREQELADRFGARTTGGGIVEPLEVDELDTPLAGDTERAAPSTATQRPSNTPGARTAGGRPGVALTPEGPSSADPREPGLNYLVLDQRLSFDEAQDVVRFLSERGLQAVATPIDQSGRGSNNPIRYRLIVLRGFDGAEYSARRAEREAIEAEAQRLGRLWQEAGGSSSFPQPLWMKYQP